MRFTMGFACIYAILTIYQAVTTTSAAVTTSVQPTTSVPGTFSVTTTTMIIPYSSVSPTSSKLAITSLAPTSSIPPTTTEVTSTTPITTLPPEETLTIDATMSTTYPFSDDLLNSSTEKYKLLTSRIEERCEIKLRPFRLFERCFVRGYRRGSTLVDLTVIFRKETNATAPLVEQRLKEGNQTEDWGFKINSVNATVRPIAATPGPTQKPSEFEVWKIVLIAFGVLCFILLIILLVCCIRKRDQKGYHVPTGRKGRNEIMEYNAGNYNKGQARSDFELYDVYGINGAAYDYPDAREGSTGQYETLRHYDNTNKEELRSFNGSGAVYDNPDARKGSTGQYATLDLYDNANNESQYQSLASNNEK